MSNRYLVLMLLCFNINAYAKIFDKPEWPAACPFPITDLNTLDNCLKLQNPPKNFNKAKILSHLVNHGHRETFYCGCPYNQKGIVIHHDCGFKPAHPSHRSYRVEWEHIMPAYDFGKSLPCWQKTLCRDHKTGKSFKGRNCCRKISPLFRRMESDLHNLVPAIGEINQARSYYTFNHLPDTAELPFGKCLIKIDSHQKQVEPRADIRGFIARSYLYMRDQYGLEISTEQLTLFKNWQKLYPPTPWELERDQRISLVQGNNNPHIYSVESNEE